MKKLTKKQRKFQEQLKETMEVLRGVSRKVVAFSERQSKAKSFMWEDLP